MMIPAIMSPSNGGIFILLSSSGANRIMASMTKNLSMGSVSGRVISVMEDKRVICVMNFCTAVSYAKVIIIWLRKPHIDPDMPYRSTQMFGWPARIRMRVPRYGKQICLQSYRPRIKNCGKR